MRAGELQSTTSKRTPEGVEESHDKLFRAFKLD